MRYTSLMIGFIFVCVLSMHFVKMARQGAETERTFYNLPLLYEEPKPTDADRDADDAKPPGRALVTAAQ